MQAVFSHLDFFLNFQETFSLQRAARISVTVKRGSVWVTQDGHLEDRVLEAGQTLRIRDNDPVLFSALKPAELAIDEAPRRAAAEHWLRNVKAAYLRLLRARAALWRRGEGYSSTLRHSL